MSHQHLSTRVRRIVVIAATLLLVALGLSAPASAATPTPTLVASAVTTTIAPPCGPPACSVPPTLAVIGTPFTLTVTLTAAGVPAAFKTNTTLTLTATGGGTLSPSSVVMSANVSTQSFSVSYSTYANGVTITASAGTGKKAPASTPSNPFDVLQTVKTDHASPNTPFQDGSGVGNCASISAANPICGILILPNGSNSDVLLSTGSCVGIGCNTKGVVTQVIADLTSTPLYTNSAPAKLFIRCYRTICGQGGVNKFNALASLSGTGPLQVSPPCPAKGTVGANQSFCTDYVSSNRANADELDLIVLFLGDFRGAI